MDIKRELVIEEYLDYYSNNYWCRNCGAYNHMNIKKGVKVKDVSFACSKCGCKIKG
jgi:peptide subunit release factor 1 (eRF1)